MSYLVALLGGIWPVSKQSISEEKPKSWQIVRIDCPLPGVNFYVLVYY
jgi:hypothetical protein